MLKLTMVVLALGSASLGCGGNDVPESTAENSTMQASLEPAATFIVYTLPG